MIMFLLLLTLKSPPIYDSYNVATFDSYWACKKIVRQLNTNKENIAKGIEYACVEVHIL